MLDIIIIMIILFGAIVGFKRGIIKQSVITVGMIFVLILSFILKNPVSSIMYEHLPFFSFGGLFENLAVLNIIVYEGFAFLLVFSVLSTILIILIKISSEFEKILRGAILGAVEYYLIVFIILFILSSPIFGLNNNKFFTESNIRNFILEKTPFVSKEIDSTISSLNDINDLIKEKDKLSDSEFNCKSIDIMEKNKVIEKDSLEYLYSKNKITKCKVGE